MLWGYYWEVADIFKRWGLEHWRLAFRREKGLHSLSLLSFIPGFEKGVLVCHMKHHEVGPSIHLKVSGTTSHGLELLKKKKNQPTEPFLIIS